MSEQRKMVCGDYALNAEGDIYVAACGDALVLEASGAATNEFQGAVNVVASTMFSAVAGSTLFAMIGESESSGQIGLVAPPEGSIKFGCGVPDMGPRVNMEPETITLQIGAPGGGASITMTPESITLRVAEVSLTLTPEGITEAVAEVTREVTPEGHNMTAAETEFNVGVQGVAWEGPTETQEVEGGAVENETLGSHTTDAAKNEDAGIALEV